ncbi:hypothetical protein HPP92_021816 [Vanilla planifolia]|uniref:Uncharacterized protein n=1 Tax=Vanilla planifolia TaxID=51239 RepID=A0A835Q1V8_VANPL|nr:hypothetical protein HPP92_021816 [Vanilla planifolia]
MAVASLVEVKRLAVVRKVESLAAAAAARSRHGSSALPISVFILIPQFFLVGAGEAFIYTGQLDFFITRSPKGMKTMSTGMFLSTISLGFFLSSLLVSIVKAITGGRDGKGWLGDSIDDGRLDCFYGLLSVLSAVNFVAFLGCAFWDRQRGTGEELKMENKTVRLPSAGDEC